MADTLNATDIHRKREKGSIEILRFQIGIFGDSHVCWQARTWSPALPCLKGVPAYSVPQSARLRRWRADYAIQHLVPVTGGHAEIAGVWESSPPKSILLSHTSFRL